MDKKICGRCAKEKLVFEFPLRKKKNKNTGVEYIWPRLQCYDCMRVIGKERYNKDREKVIKRNWEYEQKNKDKVAAKRDAWHKLNADKVREQRATRYLNNCEELKRRRKEYYNKNKEQCIKSVTEYIKNNKDKILAQRKKLHQKKSQSDIQYLLKRRLRGRLRAALKDKKLKVYKSMDLVGCTIDFLVSHIESLFTDGMNWSNMREWHIDHKKPCVRFDLTKPEEQKVCFHWSNLQPLWGADNIKKGTKYIE